MARANKIAGICGVISEWSLYILIFTLPFAKSIVEITIATALAGLVIKKAVKRERPLCEFGYPEIFLVLFLAASLPSLLNTHYMALSMRAFFSKSLKFAALFLMVREILDTREKIHRFVVAAAASSLLILADGFIQYFLTHRDLLHGYTPFKYRNVIGEYFVGFPTASFPFPNDFAAWLITLIFPAGIYFLFARGGWREKTASGLIFFGLLYSLILTKARGAWLGFLAALVPLAFIGRMKKVLVLLAIISLFAFVFINRSLIPDIFSMMSVRDRATMWENGWEIFKRHPVIGSGLNTFYQEYMMIRNDKYKNTHGSYAHNCYLQMAADTGIVGLAAFLFFVTALIVKGFNSLPRIRDPGRHSLVLGINLGLIAFLVHSGVDTNLYSLNLAALFWTAAGFMLAMIKADSEPQ